MNKYTNNKRSAVRMAVNGFLEHLKGQHHYSCCGFQINQINELFLIKPLFKPFPTATPLKKYIEISIYQDNNGFIVKIPKEVLKEILK